MGEEVAIALRKYDEEMKVFENGEGMGEGG